MKEKLEDVKIQTALFVAIQITVLILLLFFLGFEKLIWAFLVALVEILLLTYVIYHYETGLKDRLLSITRVLGSDAKDALAFGQSGLLMYDDNLNVTWVSDYPEDFIDRFLGQRITSLWPDTKPLFQGDADRALVNDGDRIFEVTRRSEKHVLFFRDVTHQQQLEVSYEDEKVVMGLIHLDNYEDTTQYQEEQVIANIDTLIRQPIVEWAKKYKMFIRRTRADRYLLVLNEKIFKQLAADKFSIVSYIRNESTQNDFDITVSLAFARGTEDYTQLAEMVNSLMELALSRGGDQVAVRKFGEEVHYYGGRSEATEKRSKVRVRVLAQTFRDLIVKSDRVLITSHMDMDFDAMGSSLAISRIIASYNKPVSIVCLSGGIEEKLGQAMAKYESVLETRHDFITEDEALALCGNNTLVVMTDHHNPDLSNAPALLNKAKKIVIFDHHRRIADFGFNPLMVYIEASASSVSELITEFLPYQLHRVSLCWEEATIMYAGILIDTMRFKNRTGSRTFEAAASLRQFGAEPAAADELLKDSYREFELKTAISNFAQDRGHGIIVTPYADKKAVNRVILSQVADSLMEVQGVQAAFVIAAIGEGRICISARSTGKINVQRIMEQLNGGGHFTAAAVVRENTSVTALTKELDEAIEAYIKEEEPNEDHIEG
ncbi:MAG: DHH family phosphoesterase [Erysipelotrichaceae bacterium]|jgi:c-di-AMP phosphodiesterase-like protein|nr:DHH family phosphoesterase [Erysipelotrichaceae bacterium]